MWLRYHYNLEAAWVWQDAIPSYTNVTISTSQHLTISTPHHINTSPYQHLTISTPHHINTSPY
ncbi:hypothetical protein, partial [Leyella stercorea]|uniref:hypothetical protein n=1 Tax=Leyella stercorea TaxID=363265 RepID=UPI00242E41BF